MSSRSVRFGGQQRRQVLAGHVRQVQVGQVQVGQVQVGQVQVGQVTGAGNRSTPVGSAGAERLPL